MPPISKDEDGIPQYVRARLTVLTLLFDKLEPALLSRIYISNLCPNRNKKIINLYLTIFGTLAVHCELLLFIDLQRLSRDDSKYGYDSDVQNFYLKIHHEFQKMVLISLKDLYKIHIFPKFHRYGSKIVPATPF